MLTSKLQTGGSESVRPELFIRYIYPKMMVLVDPFFHYPLMKNYLNLIISVHFLKDVL